MELLRLALTELSATKKKKYLDEKADRKAASGYYAELDEDAEAPALFSALSSPLEDTHRVRPRIARPSSSIRGSTSSPTGCCAASTPRRSSIRRS